MYALQLAQIGEEIRLQFPEDLLVRYKLREADEVYLVELPDGFFLTLSNSDIEAQLKAATEIIEKRRGALREMATSGGK